MSDNSNLEFRKIKSLNYLYEVNENGTIFRNVKSKKQSKIKLDMHHSDYGYYMTFVHIGGRRPDAYTKRVMIHSVVAECWLGERPEGYEIDHIDRNAHNNDYRNLRYVTRSQQMKNRDHSGIGARGAKNLADARKKRMIGVIAVDTKTGISYQYESLSQCSRELSKLCSKCAASVMDRLAKKRSHAYGFDLIYLNAETGHGGSTEQGTVHKLCDLTGDYKTAFNEGKQQEVEMRVKHGFQPVTWSTQNE